MSGESRSLDPRIRTVWRVSALVRVVMFWIVVTVVLLPFVVTERAPRAVLVLVVLAAIGAAVFAWWWPGVRYRHWTYRMGQDTMELEHGVLFQTHSVIPYFRVQHVDTSQGPVDRRLALSNLKVQTASTATDAFIPGLSNVEAADIRRTILERAGDGDAV